MTAPDKIYLATTEEIQNLDNSFVGIAHSDPEDIVNPVEYVRKDALVEKAKAYDKLIKRLKDFQSEYRFEIIEKYFPELKESDDERTRKAIRYAICQSTHTDGTLINGVSSEEALAWLEKQGESVEINPTEFDTRLQTLIGKFDSLPKEELIGSLSFWLNMIQNDGTYKDEEKQGGQETLFVTNIENSVCPILVKKTELGRCAVEHEQKPADKTEPKFHEGDWINGYYTNYKVLSVNNEGYVVEDVNGNKINILFENEKFHHLWTIQDTKDGDVLTCNEEILLFKSYSVQGRISLYCWYNGRTNNFHSKEVDDTSLTTRNKICPATKEQCDLLFQKMREAGYEWDSEKKELRKIEQKPAGVE